MLRYVILVDLRWRGVSIVVIRVIVCSVVCFISYRVMGLVGFVESCMGGVRFVGIVVSGVLSVRLVTSWTGQVHVSPAVTSLSKGVSNVPRIQPVLSAWPATISATQPISASAATSASQIA
jgi:hypothetical protein